MKTCLHILIVSLNPGEKLKKTLDSIFAQTVCDYRIIIKDGGSTDGTLEKLSDEGYFTGHDNVITVREHDSGIYDGMNRVVEIMLEELGDEDHYCLFLNCGDTLYDEKVLEKVIPYLNKTYDKEHIFYGDQYNTIQKCKVSSSPNINEFTLFRNVPCHQVCFYSTKLFRRRAYNIRYTVRADYEHFLYCCYEENAECEHIDVIICDYEGGGYSETPQNRKRSAEQHREITDRYMGYKAKKYRLIMMLTLAPLRTRLAESPTMSGVYNGIKSLLYRR